MAHPVVYLAVVILFFMLCLVNATPPGTANYPSKASCKLKKYKHCYNLEQVCPEFCPEGACTVECASCKPVCTEPLAPPHPSSEEERKRKLVEGKDGGDDDGSRDKKEEKGKGKGDDKGNKGGDRGDDDEGKKGKKEGKGKGNGKGGDRGDDDGENGGGKPKSPGSPMPPSSLSPPVPSTPEIPPTLTPPSPPTPSTPRSPPTSSSPPTPPSPSSSAASPVKAKCTNAKYAHCYNLEQYCPNSCPGGCEIDCVSCKPVCRCDKPGAVCQDPRFIGGDGITFYFHGEKNRDFCLVSDSNLHINAHFIGKRNQNMRRDFTWVLSIGILFDNHQLFIGARKTATWDDAVDRLALAFDGTPIFLPEAEGAKWQPQEISGVSITRTHVANSVSVEVEGNLKITATVVPITEKESQTHNYDITKEDCFAHLDLGFKFYSLSGQVNGVLGQTYRDDYVSRVKIGASMPVMGGDREFASSSLFSTDCAVARFGMERASIKEVSEFSSLRCGSGMDGRGVVCKR